MSNLKIARKLSVSEIVGRAEVRKFKEYVAETSIARIAGIARRYKVVPTPHGESIAFTGDFRATSLLDGSLSRSATLYLVSPVDELLAAQIDSFGDGAEIEFAFEITVRPDDKSVTGYVYGTKTLLETIESDPMENLLARLGDATISTPQIAAPAAETKQEGEKAKSKDTAK